jgi:hypothetical protein
MADASDLDQLYLDLAEALALIVYGRCVAYDDEHAVYQHFNENRLGIPPDILARLGIMRGVSNVDFWMTSGAHAFLNDWTPDKPLQVRRHAGEPTLFDLIAATCLMIDWDKEVSKHFPRSAWPVPEVVPSLDLKNERRFQSPEQLVFQFMALRKGAACIERLGLGEWDNEGRFELIYALRGSQPIDLADTYQQTRHLIAERLGGVRFLFPS